MFQRKMAVRMGQSELGNVDGGHTMIARTRGLCSYPTNSFQNEVG